MFRKRIKWWSVMLMLNGAIFTSAQAAVPSAQDVIQKMEALLWSNSNQGNITMVIETPYWKRSLELEVWMARPDRTFIRVLSPKKERGIGSLRVGSQMWNYIPKIDRIVKIPPSMMLQPWMGSDFSNDDLVKESSLITDYTHEVKSADNENSTLIRIVSIPKPDAAVVWGSVESWVYADTGIPQRQLYFDEAGKAVKELLFSEVQNRDGRKIPTRWEMRPLEGKGKRTIININEIQFDQQINADVFAERNLRKLNW